MKQLVSIGALFAVSAATWHVGASMSHDSMWLAFGLLLGVFVVGLPTALIVASVTSHRARLDVYHHTVAEIPREPAQQPTAAITARPAMIAQQSERYKVIEPSMKRIEQRAAQVELPQPKAKLPVSRRLLEVKR